jgi:hypothetical protein
MERLRMTVITTTSLIILLFITGIIGFAAYLIISDFISNKKWKQLIWFSIGLLALILNLAINSWILTSIVLISVFFWGD